MLVTAAITLCFMPLLCTAAATITSKGFPLRIPLATHLTFRASDSTLMCFAVSVAFLSERNNPLALVRTRNLFAAYCLSPRLIEQARYASRQ